MRASGEFDPVLVARMESNYLFRRSSHPGAPFSAVEGDPNQYFVFQEDEAVDFFYMSAKDKSFYTTYFANFLKAQKPDVVHFQHTSFLGYELISLTRRVLPDAPILYTLQEYMPICNRDGQLLRTRGEELCLQASPRRCHECFPDIPEQNFFLRTRFVKAHFEHVDLFLAPSHFLRARYIDWGIAPERIRFEDYGRLPAKPIPTDNGDRPRTRLSFLGQLPPYKGADVLLKAMSLLGD